MRTIGVLTSSRADYGIYLPLLKRLSESQNYKLELIVFGTHLSANYGHTLDEIERDGFDVKHKIDSLLEDDTPYGIASSMAKTMACFSDFWASNGDDFDLVFALGDRFEMFSAVYASTAFGIRVAHIHGGETTLGAIDNIFRHAISHASDIHFVSTDSYANKVAELTGSDQIYNSGALSLDGIEHMQLLDKTRMLEQWKIDFDIPTILITVNPETKSYEKNTEYSLVFSSTLEELSKNYQLVITMPNADTNGSLYRKAFQNLALKYPKRIVLVENFGRQSYFSAMKWSRLLLGNTSSGIIEAASFGKYVIDLGDRQKGRMTSKNTFNVSFDKGQIIPLVEDLLERGVYEGENVYFQESPSLKIMKVLDQLL